MHIKSILNRIAKQPGFVFASVRLACSLSGLLSIVIGLRAHARSRPICAGCMHKRRCYDHLPERRFAFVPLWNIPVWFVYAPRRADCPRCGVTVEAMPWATGKSPITSTFAWFLASWAKVLSWTETARHFGTSWHVVFDAVGHAVEWGRAHRNLDGIRSVGVDELSWKKGHKFLTLVYQVDHRCKRLLWIGRDRTSATFTTFFDWLGEPRSRAIEFIVSDMWKAFLGTASKRASAAVHVLDRFHVAKLFSQAIDETRRSEARVLRERGDQVTLKKTRRSTSNTSGAMPRHTGPDASSIRGPHSHELCALIANTCSTGFARDTPSRWAPSRASTTRPASPRNSPTVSGPTSMLKSPCCIASERYPSPRGSPSDSFEVNRSPKRRP